MLKKILGILIFVLLGVLFFGAEILAHGWTTTLLSIVVACAISGFIVLGLWLLVG